MLGQRDKPKHARSRGLVHQFPESAEINGSGGAGVHRRRYAGGQTERIQVYTVRIYTPVAVHVKVDEAGRDIAAGDVEHTPDVLTRQRRADGADTVTDDTDIELVVYTGGRIDQRAAAQDEVKLRSHISGP